MNETHSTLTTAHGARLAIKTFDPQGPALATLVVVHGYLEHGGRYRPLAQALTQHKLRVVVADLRGHGLSDGPRGHIDSFKDYRSDIFEVLTAARLSAGPMPQMLLGHSLGGLIALDYALNKAPQLAALVVTNPFLAPAMRIPRSTLWLGKVMLRVWPSFAVRAGLDPKALTQDEQVLMEARQDPLIFDRTTARWFDETTRAQKRVAQGGAIAMPLLAIVGMDDAIASPQASLACFAALHAPEKTVWQRQHERHEVLNELGRKELYEDLAQWLLRQVT